MRSSARRLSIGATTTFWPRPPQIVVRAGDEILPSVLADVADNLTVRFRVPRAALDRADGLVTIQTVSPFVRQFKAVDPSRPFPGLRVFDITIEPAPPGS
jgi:hypothetical protein